MYTYVRMYTGLGASGLCGVVGAVLSLRVFCDISREIMEFLLNGVCRGFESQLSTLFFPGTNPQELSQ